MTKEAVFEKLKDILIKEFELEEDEIKPEALLSDDLGLDSIDAIDLIVKMKDLISEKINPEMFKSARTVQDIIDILQPLIKD